MKRHLANMITLIPLVVQLSIIVHLDSTGRLRVAARPFESGVSPSPPPHLCIAESKLRRGLEDVANSTSPVTSPATPYTIEMIVRVGWPFQVHGESMRTTTCSIATAECNQRIYI